MRLDSNPGWITEPEDRIWTPLDLRGHYRFGSLHLHRRVLRFPRQEVEGTSSGDRLDTKAGTFFNAGTLGERDGHFQRKERTLRSPARSAWTEALNEGLNVYVGPSDAA